MDIEIPPWLQWVSYLAGGMWPQGSENGMFRIDEHSQGAASDLNDLLPQLNSVREETLSVLIGETAQAADEHFSMLFDGDYAVGNLANALSALGDGARFLGSEIQYSKESIIAGLALAAWEIRRSILLSNATGGISLAEIPLIELWANASIRRIV